MFCLMFAEVCVSSLLKQIYSIKLFICTELVSASQNINKILKKHLKKYILYTDTVTDSLHMLAN